MRLGGDHMGIALRYPAALAGLGCAREISARPISRGIAHYAHQLIAGMTEGHGGGGRSPAHKTAKSAGECEFDCDPE